MVYSLAYAQENYNEWSQIPLHGDYAIVGNSMLRIAVNPLNPRVLYAGTMGGGLYKSNTQGEYWFNLNEGLDSRNILSIAIHPLDTNRVYAGTDNGLYISANSGNSWIYHELVGIHVNSIAIDPARPNDVYIVCGALHGKGNTQKGIYISENYGRTWTTHIDTLRHKGKACDLFRIKIYSDAHKISKFFVSSNQGIWASNDGRYWPRSSHDNNLWTEEVYDFAVDPENQSHLYAGTWGTVYYSNDYGAKWGRNDTLLINDHVHSLAANSELLFIGTKNHGLLKKSHADGIKIPTNTAIMNTEILDVILDPENNDIVYCVTKDNLYRSNDQGEHFETMNTGIFTASIDKFVFDPLNANKILGTSDRGTYLSNDGGHTWTKINTLPDKKVLCFAINPDERNEFYAGLEFDWIYQSNDAGFTWSKMKAPEGKSDTKVYTIAITPEKNNGTIIFAGTDDGIYRKDKYRDSFTCILDTSNPITSLLINPYQTNTIYAGTEGNIFFKSDLKKGSKVNKLSNGLPASTESAIHDIAVCPSSHKVYICTDMGLYSNSFEIDRTWEREDGLSQHSLVNLHRILVDPTNASTLYLLSTTTGISVSYDTGENWYECNPPDYFDDANQITDIQFHPHSHTLYASIKDKGLISYPRAPKLSVNRLAIDFGPVPVGSSGLDSLLIINDGTIPLYIDSHISDSHFLVDSDIVTIKPYDSTYIFLSFNPDSIDTLNAILTLNTNVPDQRELQISLQGTGSAPYLIADHDHIEFDTTYIHEVAIRSIKIRNIGNAAYDFPPTLNRYDSLFSVTPDCNSIAKGGDGILSIEYHPCSVNTHKDTINLKKQQHVVLGTSFISLTGTAIYHPYVTEISLTPDSSNFGLVPVNNRKEQPVGIMNIRNVPFTISDIISTHEYFTCEIQDLVVAPESDTIINIAFKPEAIDTLRNEYIVIISNSMTSPDTIRLSGIGTAAHISTSRKVINFGNKPIKTQHIQHFRITNSGNANFPYKAEFDAYSDYYKIEPATGNILYNSTQDFDVLFESDIVDTYPTDLVFSHLNDEYYQGDDTISVTCTTYSGAGIEIVNLPDQLTPIIPNDSSHCTFKIRNSGSKDLSITSIRCMGDCDNISVSPTSAVIPCNNAEDFSISFKSNRPDSFKAEIVIESNAVFGDTVFSVCGNCLEEAAIVSLGQYHIDFVNVNVKDSISKSITLTNTGNDSLYLENIYTNTSDVKIQFEQDTLDPNTSTDIMITYTPDTTGILHDSVIIKAETAIGNKMIALNGNAIAAYIDADDTLDFRDTSPDSQYQRTIRIHNNGTNDIEFQAEIVNLAPSNDKRYFSVEEDSYTIKSHDYLDITVYFKSEVLDNYKAYLKINSELFYYGTHEILLKSNCYAGSILNVNPLTIQFDSVRIDTAVEYNITISNLDSVTLNIDSVEQKYADLDNVFEISPQSLEISAFQETCITISFTPDTMRDYTQEFIFMGNYVDGDSSIRVTGTGIAPVIQVTADNCIGDRADFTFDDTHPGLRDTISFTVSNQGTDELIVHQLLLKNNPNNNTSYAYYYDSNGTSFPETIKMGSHSSYKLIFHPSHVHLFKDNLIISSDAFNSSENVYNISGSGRDFMPPVIVHSPPNPVRLNTSPLLNVHLQDTFSGISSAEIRYRICGDEKFERLWHTSLSGITDTTITVAVPKSSITWKGFEYYIIATDESHNITDSSIASWYCCPVQSDNIIISSEQELPIFSPHNSEENGYRLFSIPFELEKPNPYDIFHNALGTAEKDWRLMEYCESDSISRAHYITLDDSNQSVFSPFSPGKAFFFYTRHKLNCLNCGEGASISTTSPFILQLQKGWTFFGNPFNFSIPLNQIQINGTSPDFWHYDGEWKLFGFNEADSLLPWDGYAIASDSDSAQFIIYPSRELTETYMQDITPPAQALAVNWQIGIRATCGEASDESNIVGTAIRARIGMDEFDLVDPPLVGKYVNVFLKTFEERAYKKVARNIQSINEQGNQWYFEVESNIESKKILLEFDISKSIDPDFIVYLIDLDVGISHNLKRESKYSFRANSDSECHRQFKLIVGTEDYYKDNSEEIPMIPETYNLSNNYPNPFNPFTTIYYNLPHDKIVSLKIVNLMGQEVVSLVNREFKERGTHLATWDGCDKSGNPMPTGLYFCILRTDNFKKVGKMMLIR